MTNQDSIIESDDWTLGRDRARAESIFGQGEQKGNLSRLLVLFKVLYFPLYFSSFL